MKILITGASGFIGREIVRVFSKTNFELICLSSRNASKNRDDFETDNFFRADITDVDSLEVLSEIKQIDVVIHAAGLAHQSKGEPKEEFWRVNVAGTENICNLAVASRAEHFILISSVSVYGNSGKETGEIDEKSVCHPGGFYAESKLEAERIARKICAENELPLTILRSATVIGEGDRGNVARLIESIDRQRFIWVGNGENRKSLIYKNDVAKACLKILERRDGETEIFNLTAQPVKMSEIVSIIAEALGKKVPKFSIPAEFFKTLLVSGAWMSGAKKIDALLETLEKWLSEDAYSGKKLEQFYRYVPETSVREAIEREVLWYSRQKE